MFLSVSIHAAWQRCKQHIVLSAFTIVHFDTCYITFSIFSECFDSSFDFHFDLINVFACFSVIVCKTQDSVSLSNLDPVVRKNTVSIEMTSKKADFMFFNLTWQKTLLALKWHQRKPTVSGTTGQSQIQTFMWFFLPSAASNEHHSEMRFATSPVSRLLLFLLTEFAKIKGWHTHILFAIFFLFHFFVFAAFFPKYDA